MILTLVALCAAAFLTLRALFPRKYGATVADYSQMFGVDEALAFAVIRAESGFDANAVSKKGAIGLMQLTPATAEWCCEKLGDDFDENRLIEPAYNLKIGIYYLGYLLERFGNVEDAVRAYNMGPNAYAKTKENGGAVYPETSAYLKKVMFYKNIYIIIY